MQIEKVKLLAVEDNLVDRRLMQEYLKVAQNVEFEFYFADKLTKAFEMLNNDKFDVLILDLGLPDSHGIDTFYKIRDLNKDIPIVIVSGNNDEATAKQAVKDGAHDYIVKGRFDGPLLIRAVKYAIRRKEARDLIYSRSNVVTKEQQPKAESTVKPVTESLLSLYEDLIKALRETDFVKNAQIMEKIRSIAKNMQESKKGPDDLLAYARQQREIDQDSELLSLVNADITSTLISYMFPDLYSRGVLGG